MSYVRSSFAPAALEAIEQPAVGQQGQADRSQIFFGAWFAQILNVGQPDNIGAFELQPPGGGGDFPIEVFRKLDSQLRLHGVLQRVTLTSTLKRLF